jgi:hypothetical protein
MQKKEGPEAPVESSQNDTKMSSKAATPRESPQAASGAPPFKQTDELVTLGDTHLPGHPRIHLQDKEGVYQVLTDDMWSHDLEAISHRLWWLSTVDSKNISPLHRQAVKRRTIIVTEEPKLHLVWLGDRIFIKPIPHYLLSHDFWLRFLPGPAEGDPGAHATPGARSPPSISDIRRAALGFLRTYFYLIKHESDFRVAQQPDLCLIPAHVSWVQFCAFSSSLGGIQDDEVSGRYHFGELRLSRLNFYAPLLLRRSNFQRVHYQYAEYFGRLYAPILLALSFLSVVLSSMQVAAQYVPADPQLPHLPWAPALFFWFSIITMPIVLLVLLVIELLWWAKTAREWRHAVADWRRFQKRLGKRRAGGGD